MPIFTKNKSIEEYDAETEVTTNVTTGELNFLKAYQYKGTMYGAITRYDADKTFYKIEYDERYNKDLFDVISLTMNTYGKYFLPKNEVGVQKSRNTSIEINENVKEPRGLQNKPTDKYRDSFIVQPNTEQYKFIVKKNTTPGYIRNTTYDFYTFIRYNDFIKSKKEYLITHDDNFKKINNDTSKTDTQGNITQENNVNYSTTSELHTTAKQTSEKNANTNNVCKDIKYICNCTPVNTDAIKLDDIDVINNKGGKKYRFSRKSNKVKNSKAYKKYRFLNQSINKRKPFNKLTRKDKRKRRLPPPF